MSLDRFLDRMPAPGYDCATFARDVWLHLTGQDIADASGGLLAAQFVGRISKGSRLAFRTLHGPVDPCLVVMRRPRTGVHMGVFVRGRVIHLKQNGVEFQPIEVAAKLFKRVEYVAC